MPSSLESVNENVPGFNLYSWPNGEDLVVTFIPRGPALPSTPEREWTEPSPIGRFCNIVGDVPGSPEYGQIVGGGRVYGEPTFGTFNVEIIHSIDEDERKDGEVYDLLVPIDRMKGWLWYKTADDMWEGYENFVPAPIPVPVIDAPATKRKFSIRDIKDPRSYTFPPQRWIIPGWLSEGSYLLIVAGYGQGKSNLSLAMCRSISEGRPFLGFDVEPRPVVYIDRENPWEPIKARFDWLGMAKDNPNMLYFGRHVPGEEVPGPDAQYLLDFVKEEKVKPVIVFDSLVRFLATGNDSSTPETSLFGKQIMALRDAGAAIVVLHHSGKGESTLEGRGSTDITAACDFKLQMEATKLEGLKLRQIKVSQPRARLHAENGIPTAPEQPILIDIDAQGAFTLNGMGVTKPIAGTKRPQEEIDRTLISLLHAMPGCRGCDLEEKAKSQFLSREMVNKWLKHNVASGAVKVTKDGDNKTTKLHTWVGPEMFTNFPLS